MDGGLLSANDLGHHAPEARREQAAEFWQQGIVLGRQQSQTDAQQQQSQESERNVPRQTQ